MPVSIQFKPIKAKKYQPFVVLQEIGKALAREGAIEQRMFEKTTRTWKRKVVFMSTIGIAGGRAYVATGTDDKIYGYVNDGTRPHVIVPKRARVLRFRGGYKSKTSPRVIGSHSGGASGKFIFARRVKHPGTKARQFAQEIQKRRKAQFYKNIQAAITKGLSKLE